MRLVYGDWVRRCVPCGWHVIDGVARPSLCPKCGRRLTPLDYEVRYMWYWLRTRRRPLRIELVPLSLRPFGRRRSTVRLA